MKSILYVEGGGETKALRTECRKGFRKFFEKIGLKGRMPRVSACGGRQQAYDDFCHAFKAGGADGFVALLVDSEGPATKGLGPWAYLKKRDNWEKPKNATDENAHLMVQCMEAWFLADKDTLVDYFGDGFNRKALPAQANVEDIPKTDIERGLKSATRQCTTKGRYDKGRHSFALLAQISPEKVTTASPHAKRLIDTLVDKASGH